MAFPQKYVDFLVHFHGDRDYFECHEVLEDHWKENGMGRDSVWAGLIQTAVGMYHYRRGNLKGAKKMMQKSISLLAPKEEILEKLGIEPSALLRMLCIYEERITAGLPYKPANLPIYDTALLNLCETQCLRAGFEWCGEAVPGDEIIHRHLRRDRAPVIAERERMRLAKRSADPALAAQPN